MLKARYDTHSDIPSLDRALVREYPGWTQEVPDVVKAGDILAHLGDWESAHAMPDLVMVILPNDHTEGTSAGWCTPRACVADNDFALGKIVEGLSKSSFWKDMAILVVEDDAQDGVDHIDGHRTVALAISPFIEARRSRLDDLHAAEHGEDDRADAGAAVDVDLRSRGDGHARELHRARRAAEPRGILGRRAADLTARRESEAGVDPGPLRARAPLGGAWRRRE